MKYGDVSCVAGGQALTVRYGNLAWDRLMRKLGASSKVGALLKARESDENFLLLVREGLAAHHPQLTAAQVRELYDELLAADADPADLPLKDAVWEAVTLSLPELSKLLEASQEKASGSGPKAKRTKERPSARPH